MSASETGPLGDESLLAEAIEARLAGRDVDLLALAGGDPKRAALLASALERALGLLPPSGEIPERLGPYRILRRLGAGGMGAVWLGLHEELRRLAAVKVLPPPLCYVGENRERFRREARAMARVRHPGVLPILEVGESGGIPYAALEYVPGGTLEDLLAELRPLDLDVARRRGAEVLGGAEPYERQIAALLAQVADALAAVHVAGVIHRDVKPANLLLAPEGRALLGDFGVALEHGASTLTQSGALVGTSRYLAPELVRGGTGTAASDLYALGVTLYELLTLQAPFAGDTQGALFREILERPAPQLRSKNHAVGRDLEAVCLLLLEKNPGRRYPDAASLAADLRAAAAGAPVSARSPGAARRLGGWMRYHRARLVTASSGLFLVLALGVGGQLWRREVQAAEGRTWEQSFSQVMALYVAADGAAPGHAARDGRAAELLKVCSELRPEHADTWLLQADFALRLDKAAEAARFLTSARERGARGVVYRDLMKLTREAGAEVPDALPDPPTPRLWRSRGPLERISGALKLIHGKKWDAANEIASYPVSKSESEYATAWEVITGVVLYGDAVSDKPVLAGSPDKALRVALDAFDAALAEIPGDEIVSYNRAILIRQAVVKGIYLGPGMEGAWPSAEEFFRQQYATEPSAETRSEWLATLRANYLILKRDEALPEAMAVLSNVEQAEVLGYAEEPYDAALMLLAAAGDYSRAYELIREHGIPRGFEAAGPMHWLLFQYVATLLNARRQGPMFDALEETIASHPLDEKDLAESRRWIDTLKAKVVVLAIKAI